MAGAKCALGFNFFPEWMFHRIHESVKIRAMLTNFIFDSSRKCKAQELVFSIFVNRYGSYRYPRRMLVDILIEDFLTLFDTVVQDTIPTVVIDGGRFTRSLKRDLEQDPDTNYLDLGSSIHNGGSLKRDLEQDPDTNYLDLGSSIHNGGPLGTRKQAHKYRAHWFAPSPVVQHETISGLHIKLPTHIIHIIWLLCSILKAIPAELICEYENEKQLPEQTKDYRPIAKSSDGLISDWHKKLELKPKPGDIIQYDEHQHAALYLGKDVGHIFGEEFKDYDVLFHMKENSQKQMYVKLHDWAKEKYINYPRIYNVLESKYSSFSVMEMAKRAKKWVGCKVTKYSYEKYNCEHLVHLIKHGKLESTIENDLKKFYEESNPEIFSLTREIGNGANQHPKTIVSQNAKFIEHFYELVPGKGGNPPTLKIANYPHLVLHFLAPYMNMMGDQLLQRALQGIKTQPVSKEPHIQSLLDKMEALWCAEAIKIAPPKTPVQLFQCGNNGTHFNIAALVLRDIVKVAKLALKDFLDFIKPMIDGNHDNEWLNEQRKTSDNPMLYMKRAAWMGDDHLYDAFKAKRCVEEKFLDKLWRSAEIKDTPPRPYEIEIVHFH
ncbi:lecithin retinol acyltransferase domain-containing protein [Ditylenchus destructor]|uniref:Lecithin retinol acyltransferase domain-containing protein n=1 Tax=Ditylenchus destructor TaxID=166010 RepID=A0AAD4QT60_9BILA|nr:lecithin retinol acyltransferase domain-containing protein [Ditylenchus destructor]